MPLLDEPVFDILDAQKTPIGDNYYRYCVAKLNAYLPELFMYQSWLENQKPFWQIQQALYQAEQDYLAQSQSDPNSISQPPLELPKAQPNRVEGGYQITSLQFACIYNQVEQVQQLINQHQADVNAQDPWTGKTALHFAALFGHAQCVELLLKADGIDVNKRDKAQATPLLDACRAPGLQSLQLLLRNKAVELDVAQLNGKNALWIATEYGDKEKVELLQQFKLNSRHHCRWYQFSLPSDLARQQQLYCERQVSSNEEGSSEESLLKRFYQEKLDNYVAIQPILKQKEKNTLWTWKVPVFIGLFLGAIAASDGIFGVTQLIQTSISSAVEFTHALPFLLPVTLGLFAIAGLIFAGCIVARRRRYSQQNKKIRLERVNIAQMLQQKQAQVEIAEEKEQAQVAEEKKPACSQITDGVESAPSTLPLNWPQLEADFRTLCGHQRQVLRQYWIMMQTQPGQERNEKTKEAFTKVKNKYRELARQCHSDKNTQQDTMMQTLNILYDKWRNNISEDRDGDWHIQLPFWGAAEQASLKQTHGSQSYEYWRNRITEIDKRSAEIDKILEEREADVRETLQFQQETRERLANMDERLARIQKNFDEWKARSAKRERELHDYAREITRKADIAIQSNREFLRKHGIGKEPVSGAKDNCSDSEDLQHSDLAP